jgi:hypothetical protein
MRKYQPIWEAIKLNGATSLRAPVATHDRIIGAVRKEKCRDLGWSLLLSEKGQKLFLIEVTVGEVITFTLEDTKRDKLLLKSL